MGTSQQIHSEIEIYLKISQISLKRSKKATTFSRFAA